MPSPEARGLRLSSTPGSTLANAPFMGRLEGEVRIVERRGGVLSLILIGCDGVAGDGLSAPLPAVMESLKRRLRPDDVVAPVDLTIAVLLPETTADEAVGLAEILMGDLRHQGRGGESGFRAGIASVVERLEGGGQALLDAADEALQKAEPGQVVVSRSLRGRPSALVVDDDLPFAQTLADALSDRGWDGHPCSSTEDAAQRVRDPGYSAVFVDLVLAGGSGIDILHQALSSRPERPVVLMSGYGVKAAIREVLDTGPVLFLSKPILPVDLDRVASTLREQLPGRTTTRRAKPGT